MQRLRLFAACASSPTYRADPLTLFLPRDFAQARDQDVEIVAGRLTEESEVVRALGAKSAGLAAGAAVFQVRITTEASPVKVLPDSFELQLPTGETVKPRSSGMVIAAVSGSYNGPTGGLAKSDAQGMDTTAQALYEVGFVALTSAVSMVVESIARSGPERYWDAARADIERKTGSPREIMPGNSLDLLVVFWPRMGTIPASCTLTVTVELTQNGEICREQLALVHP